MRKILYINIVCNSIFTCERNVKMDLNISSVNMQNNMAFGCKKRLYNVCKNSVTTNPEVHNVKNAVRETNSVLWQSIKDFFSALVFKPKNYIEPFSSNRYKNIK